MSVDLIRYDLLVQDALRGVVRRVLTDVARDGLPGDHHLYISFDTTAPGVRLSARLKERYPEEMTIVLQHQFWDLIVTETFLEVGLSFNGIPERLHVPFAGLKGFFDPSVKFGLQFEPMAMDEAEDEQPAPEPAPAPVAVARPTSVPSTRAPSVGEPKAAGRKPEPVAPVSVAPLRPTAVKADAPKTEAAKPDAAKPEGLKLAPSQPDTAPSARPAPVASGDEAATAKPTRANPAPGKPAPGKPVSSKPVTAKPAAPVAAPSSPASEPADGAPSGDGEGKGAQVVRLDAFRKK